MDTRSLGILGCPDHERDAPDVLQVPICFIATGRLFHGTASGKRLSPGREN
jgi:hypothetical protein